MEPSSNPSTTEQILSAVSHLSLPELEQVFDRVLALQAQHKAEHLSVRESALLACINQGLPSELLRRVAALRTKREDESLSDTEYGELTQLTDRTEELHADRMTALVELAQLRGVSLPVLMNQLGLRFPDNV